MAIEIAGLLLIGILLFLLVFGFEIAIAMGITAAIGFTFVTQQSHIQIPWSAWGTLNSFTLLAMPLFIFMGAMFSNSGAVQLLFSGVEKWVNFLPGGLATAVIGANAIFGAMSGSSIAASATFSMLSFPEMEKRGYDPKLAFGSIAIGGTLSVLIPPSLILIVYCSWENLSVAQIFAAAIIPGFILALLLALTVICIVKIHPEKAPKAPASSFKEKMVAIKDLFPWLVVIGLVMGAIFGGIMTPTEAAALGAVLSVLLALFYGKLSYAVLKDSALTAVKVTAMIGFVLYTARLLSFIFQSMGLTDIFAEMMLSLPLNKYGILFVICIMYLVLGMFFDSLSMMVLTLPFVMPIIKDLGFDPVWWGVTYVILAEIGLVTPPFGLNLFTINSVLPQYSIMEIAVGTLPFLIPMLLIILILVLFPGLALWLPSVIY